MKPKKLFIFVMIAILFSIIAYGVADEALNKQIAFEVVVNNTNLAPTIHPEHPGTGERVSGVTYWANESTINLYVFAHANIVSDTAEIHLAIDGVTHEDTSGRPLGGAESSNKTAFAQIPKGSNYSVTFLNYHHYEWREHKILSGKNGTLSINQTIIGATNETINPHNMNGSNISSGTIAKARLDSYYVNLTGDTMTGKLIVTNITIKDTNTNTSLIDFYTKYNIRMLTYYAQLDNGLNTLINYDAFTYNNTRNVEFRFFRNTNTAGSVFITVHAGDGTSANYLRFNAKNGDITKAGNITINGNITADLYNSPDTSALCYNITSQKISYNSGLTTCLSSSENTKYNIKNITSGILNNFSYIKPIKYTSKLDNSSNFGFVAEDIQKIYPELVGYDTLWDEKKINVYTDDGIEEEIIRTNFRKGNISGVKYENMVAILTKVIQEQQVRIDQQDIRINKICLRQPTLCN